MGYQLTDGVMTNQLTDGDGVHFALDLDAAVLTLVDVDALLHFCLTDH